MRKLFPWVVLVGLTLAMYALVEHLSAPEPASESLVGREQLAEGLVIAPRDLGLETDLDPSAPSDSPVSPVAPVDLNPAVPVDGQPFELALIEPPVTTYGDSAWTESDRVYAAAIEGMGNVDYDPALGRAARELAVFYSFHRHPAPTEALQFVLNSAGATEWGVLQSYLTTTELKDAMVAERVKALRAQLDDLGEGVRVGVGESYTLGANPIRSVCVLVSRGGFYLERFERRTRPGKTVRLAGILPRGATSASIVGMGPTHRFFDAKVTLSGSDGRFVANVKMPAASGPVLLEINAVLPGGPIPLAQLELSSGVGLPEHFDGHWPPNEADIQSDLAAEALVSMLLDIDRTRNGLPPLIDDPKLVEIARAHGRDMRDNDFVGHRSPRTGSVGDRIKAARYRATYWGENIAGNNSLWDAEAGLYYSLGHRKNLLSREATHVGIGVTNTIRHGRRFWLVTQVFAKPFVPLDVKAVAARLYAKAQAIGATAGRTYAIDPGLAHAARVEARANDPTPSSALQRATADGFIKIGGFAWTSRRFDPKDFVLPQALLRPGLSRIGIGVYQEKTGTRPITSVVVIGAGG